MSSCLMLAGDVGSRTRALPITDHKQIPTKLQLSGKEWRIEDKRKPSSPNKVRAQSAGTMHNINAKRFLP